MPDLAAATRAGRKRALQLAAKWLDEEWQRLAPRLTHTTGRDHQDVATRLAVYAELCGAFRGWASSGNEPQHGPDWRVTGGRRVAEHRRAIEQFRKDAPNAFEDLDEMHEILEDM